VVVDLMPGLRLAAVAGAWVLAGGGVVACTGGDGDGSSSAGEVASGRAGRAEPSAEDPEAVVPYLEDLLAEHDRLVAEVLAEPAIAEQPDSLPIRQYVELFVPGSELPDQVVEVWAEQAAEGVTVGPYDDDHPVVVTSIDGEVEVLDDDEVRIPTCEVRRERTYVDGELRGGVPEQRQAGATVAQRVDGRWRISTREVHADQTCQEGGS
jgi:hypothetical protein